MLRLTVVVNPDMCPHVLTCGSLCPPNGPISVLDAGCAVGVTPIDRGRLRNSPVRKIQVPGRTTRRDPGPIDFWAPVPYRWNPPIYGIRPQSSSCCWSCSRGVVRPYRKRSASGSGWRSGWPRRSWWPQWYWSSSFRSPGHQPQLHRGLSLLRPPQAISRQSWALRARATSSTHGSVGWWCRSRPTRTCGCSC